MGSIDRLSEFDSIDFLSRRHPSGGFNATEIFDTESAAPGRSMCRSPLGVGAEAVVAVTVRAPSTAQSIVNVASVSLTAPQDEIDRGNDAATVTVSSR